MVRQRNSAYFVPLLALALLLVVTWPVWRWLWIEWWSNDYYSHGVLILPISGFLAWRRWPSPSEKDPGDQRGLILLAGGVGLYLLFMEQKATYLAALATIVMLGGLVWTFGGLKLLGRLAFPLGFLALMVPLPFVERATLPLALWTGACSGWLSQRLGLAASVNGAAITLPNTTLTIGAPCSGINSLVSLITLSVLAAYVLRGPLWGRLALVGLAVPLAMLGNVLRVVNLLWVAHFLGAEAAFRYYHDFSGPIFFLIVLLLLIPLTRLFRCRTPRFEVL